MIIRFCAIDDHDIVLQGLAAMGEREPDLEFVGGAADGRAGLALIEAEKPEVALLDLRLGQSNSFPVLEEAVHQSPNTAIVMFTAFGNDDLLETAMKCGASGYVLKNTSTLGIPEVLRSVVRDGCYFDPRLTHSAIRSRIQTGRSTPTFTERELRILRMIAAGKDNHEIAEEIHVSIHTVKVDVGHLLARHGAKRRTELVRILMEKHLLPD